MKSISLFTRSIMVLMCSFLLVGCASTPSPQAARKTTVVPATSTAISVPSPTPSPTLTPPPLGVVPQDCPTSPAPRNIFPDIEPGYGTWPVWSFGLDTSIHIATSYFTYTQYGWEWKVIWRVQASYTNTVTVRGGNVRTGTPLWFQVGTQDPSMAPVLHPQERRTDLTTDRVEWGSYVYIPMAGCYYIEAVWPGGHWRLTFAAGRL